MLIRRPCGLTRILFLSLSAAVPLWACRNDADVQRDEQEFRAAYGAVGGTGSSSELLAQGLVILLLVVGLGLVLMALKTAASERSPSR